MSLQDAYGRTIDYLRISLTDKCNLRCKYCMPPEGISRLQHAEVLTLEEVCRVAGVLTEMGIRRIRLTGGEPLVRKGIDGLMRELSQLPGRPELAMTTNGVALADRLEELVAAGLRSVNISLDTRDPGKYRGLTGTDAFDAVERSVRLAVQMGLPVKINCVPIRGINDEELTGLAEYARDKKIDVRFIELMPMGFARDYQGIPEAEILEKLEALYGPAERVEEASVDRGPAKYVHFKGFQGRVGFISPLSHTFCSECNRLRLTVEGRLKLCLYYPEGLDVKRLLRDGCTDEELKYAIHGIIRLKPERHGFCERDSGTVPLSHQETRSMYEIGG